MALTHWYTGVPTETSASVVVRASTNEVVTVTANGEDKLVSCNTAVNDGNAVSPPFTGLTPGARYPYLVNGVAGGELRPFPTTYPFWVALSSCWAPKSFDPLALRLLKAPAAGADVVLHQEMVNSLALFCALGDLLYMNESGTINGYPVSNIAGGSLATAQSLTERLNYYRGCRLNGGLMSLMANVPTTLSKDDHEYDPNDACYDLDWLQAKFPGATQGDLDALWAAADGAWRSWSLGNPPSQLVGPSCYSVRIGPLEIFYTDQIYGRTYHATADGPTKYMLSPEQEEETLRQMGASTAPFKLINSTKQYISSSGFNADGWCNIGGAGQGYETQLARILKDPRFPRSGALSVTGDEHLKSDMFVPADHFGAGSAAISQISAGPATIPAIINIAQAKDGLAYRTGVRYKERDIAGGELAGISVRGENTYVLLRVLPDRIERYMLGSRYGLKYFGYVGLHDNLVRH